MKIRLKQKLGFRESSRTTKCTLNNLNIKRHLYNKYILINPEKMDQLHVLKMKNISFKDKKNSFLNISLRN